ncbi:LAMI_0H06986g1_1 [Lachancea mirantina]|uniref:LAMI_0H06986g1_1 n=1 Tax=Lachancea mirantina TaxID=1230905 RepID=A0A1G4KFF0_9SACH|nr:LAMI_0H06986g1_1 [Lachancea mirantina]
MTQDFDSALPDTLPLHPQTSLQRWRPVSHSSMFDIVQSEFYEVIKEIAMLGQPIDLRPLQNAYDELIRAQSRELRQATLIHDTKESYKNQNSEIEPLTLENWDDYRNGTLKAPKLANVYSETKQLLEQDPAAFMPPVNDLKKLITALPFILQDPQSVIPDDNNTNDEIKVEGGQIELKCPISQDFFRQPLISRKCGHVVDAEPLRMHFERLRSAGRPVECPQGCQRTISESEFIPDKLMELRLHIYKARKRPHPEHSNAVTL